MSYKELAISLSIPSIILDPISKKTENRGVRQRSIKEAIGGTKSIQETQRHQHPPWKLEWIHMLKT